MSTKTNGSESAQGAGKTKEVATVADFKKYLTRDLTVLQHLLTAIQQDDGTLEMIATVLQGRYLNHLHQEELSKQAELNLR